MVIVIPIRRNETTPLDCWLQLTLCSSSNKKTLAYPLGPTASPKQTQVDIQQCKPQKINASWGLGSGYIKVKGLQEGECIIQISMEEEAAEITHLCHIPTAQKEITIIWSKGEANQLFSKQYCAITSLSWPPFGYLNILTVGIKLTSV